MRVFLEEEAGAELPFSAKEVAGLVCEAVLAAEGCPYEAQVGVVLTDNAGIRELNLQYRGIDRETDVLSFPNVDFERAGVFEIREGSEADYFDPDTGELMLGDIMISVEKALEQAEHFGHSAKREFAFLVAHSMLHLCGYDHMEDAQRLVMEQKQEEILTGLQMTRES